MALHRESGRRVHYHSHREPDEHDAAFGGISSGDLPFTRLSSCAESDADEMGEHTIRKPAVFLDRDGVLNRPLVRAGIPFPPVHPGEFELYPDVVEGCAQLKTGGFLLVVVTNQP
ncbi:MAG: D-glycero-D-manno-heptose 1,7-bisphosphate phosphatase, partial [Verrucomicrobiota bacterium]